MACGCWDYRRDFDSWDSSRLSGLLRKSVVVVSWLSNSLANDLMTTIVNYCDGDNSEERIFSSREQAWMERQP